MKKNNKFVVFLIVLVIIIACTISISKHFQNDLFFDLKTGQSILKYGIDFKDHFSFITGLSYLYHHYLYDIVLYFIFNFFGYDGIFFLFLGMFVLFGVIVFIINKKYTSNNLASLLVTLFTIFSCSYAFQSRVQSITFILFFLEVYFINKLFEEGKIINFIYLILLSILIANLHMPIWIFTLVLYLPFMFEYLIYKKFNNNVNKLTNKLIIRHPKNEKLFIITFITLIFTGFLTPLKLYTYTFVFKSLFNNSYNFINEMSATVLVNNPYELYLILIIIVLFIIKSIKIKLSDLCLIVGLFIFSLLAKRNIIYVYIFYPTIIVKIIFESIKNIKFSFKNTNRIKKFIIGTPAIILASICLLLLNSYLIYDIYSKNNNYYISLDYPVETVKYIKNNLDYKNIRMYNEFNYGSYLEFNDIPVFIDSRAEVYIKEFNGGKDIVSDYLNLNNYSMYKDIINKYNINYALVYNESPIYYYLKSDNDFEIIFRENKVYTLFRKV